MIWNVKKIEENKSSILIAYSQGESFDGVIHYDKVAKVFDVEELASDCDEYDSKRLFQFLYGMIHENTLSFEPYSIRIG